MEQMSKPLALFVVTEDWYFCSHRLPLARALRDAGYRVAVATHLDRHEAAIRAEGFAIYSQPSLRRGLPVWKELGTVWDLSQLYGRLRPALIIHVALKPVALGGLAALLSWRPATLNILTGMGYVFTSLSLQARLFRIPIAGLLRLTLDAPRIRTVVQNQEDFDTLTANGILPVARTEIIHGSGVDTNHFSPLPEPNGPFTAAAVCRLLGDKGVYDLIEAARILRSRGEAIRILLAGPIDPFNPTAVTREEVEGWQNDGLVEWLGPVADVREVWARAHLAVLPSHREGLPKALVEAAACGRPIVTTRTTGCKEVVEEGVNGSLVPVRNHERLAAALSACSKDVDRRRRMGEAGRRMAVERFSEKVVVGRLVDLCREAGADSRDSFAANGVNIDPQTVEGFGDEWTRYDQTFLDEEEAQALFERYFSIFPWSKLPVGAVGFDMGCGSGRWARQVAPRVGRLQCIDASPAAIVVAQRALKGIPNCEFSVASVDSPPIPDSSMDFGYSLGVLHHIPDTSAGLKACVKKLKPGAPFLLYLYYSLDNRPAWYRFLWAISDLLRRAISQCPYTIRAAISSALAIGVYWPLARVSLLWHLAGGNAANFPLAYYRHSSLYTMRTDALDRFGTPLERRFSRAEIEAMMLAVGLVDVRFREEMPYWVAVGSRARERGEA